MKELAQNLRAAAEEIFSDDNAPDTAKTAARLTQCLARALERDFLSLDQVYTMFGAPGDWGYGTPIGQTLQKIYKAGADAEETPATSEEIVTFPRRPERDKKGQACLYPGAPIYKGYAALLRSKWGTPRTEAAILAPTLEALAEFYAVTFGIPLDQTKIRTAEITATDIPLS